MSLFLYCLKIDKDSYVSKKGENPSTLKLTIVQRNGLKSFMKKTNDKKEYLVHTLYSRKVKVRLTKL